MERYLKLFTFEALPTIADIMVLHHQDPSRRRAQHALARSVLRLVHDESLALRAEQEHSLIFQDSANLSTLPAPVAHLPRALLDSEPLYKILAGASLVKSNAEGRTLCKSGGVYLGSLVGHRLHFEPYSEGLSLVQSLVQDCHLVLRIGKQKIRIIKFG